MSDLKIHIRKQPDDTTAKPVWCGQINAASISAAWGYYGPDGAGHDDICRDCIDAQRAAKRAPL